MRWAMLPLVALAGCAQPPSAELELVRSRIEETKGIEGPLYAPELLAESEAALAEARRLTLEARDYRESIRVAAEARARADEAYAKAQAERRLTARRVARLVGELEGLLDIARSRGAERVAPEELSRLEARRDRVTALAERGDLLAALAEGENLKPELVGFEMRFR